MHIRIISSLEEQFKVSLVSLSTVLRTGWMNHVCCFSRNYHVFYYLLLGASEEERKEFKLLPPEDYFYLKQVQYCSPALSHPAVYSLSIWYKQPVYKWYDL